MDLGNKLSRMGLFGGETKQYERALNVVQVSPAIILLDINGAVTILSIKTQLQWNISQASSDKISWFDTDEYIYLSKSSGNGNDVIEISSDFNSGHRRTQNIEIIATDSKGKTKNKVVKLTQYGCYNGQFATTPTSEYVSGLNGGGA